MPIHSDPFNTCRGRRGVGAGGVLHLPKKNKTSSLQWHLEGINQRCRTGRIYPLWTMSGPSRHSCLELQRRLERQINAAAAAGAKVLKHQGRILSDFISSGIHPKKETGEGKKNPCKSSISPAESDGMFRICPPRGVGTGLFHRLGRGRVSEVGRAARDPPDPFDPGCVNL